MDNTSLAACHAMCWGCQTVHANVLSTKQMFSQEIKWDTVGPMVRVTTCCPVVWLKNILHFSIGDSWRTSFWFTFLESWILRTWSQKHSVGHSTIVMPPISWGTMAILAGKLSWFCFQLLFPPRQRECVLLNFIFDDLYWFCFKFFWAFLSSYDTRCFASWEGVSGPVVRPTDETHTRCITNSYLRMKHDRGRCNGIGMISRGSLNKSSLFRHFTPCVVWLDKSLSHHTSFATRPWPA